MRRASLSFARQKRHKYGAQPTVVDNIRFASKAEARRYAELKLLETAGLIERLELQPRFPLITLNAVTVGHYVADFHYWCHERKGRVVEDVKGVRTALYQWKRKHFQSQYGLVITEIGRRRQR